MLSELDFKKICLTENNPFKNIKFLRK
jgi:hypothetical protein